MPRTSKLPPRWWYAWMYLWLGGQAVWLLWTIPGDGQPWRQVVSGVLVLGSFAFIAKLEHDRRRQAAQTVQDHSP